MNATATDIDAITNMLLEDSDLLAESVCLELGDHRLSIRSNSVAMLQHLRMYFSHVVTESTDDIRAELIVVDRDAVDIGVEYVDWKREPGKTGRKDAIHDFPDGRLVHKVRTGMLFLQSNSSLIAAGPCLKYDNQVINFINTQFLNWFQNDGYVLCHAAALSRHGLGLAIAGLSGGGKSTLMLKLMEDDATTYVTNDRLLVRKEKNARHAIGIPKLPRINPGTIVNNPRLHPLLTDEQRKQLSKMHRDELWKLEQKYDVDIDHLYGASRIQHDTDLRKFLVLNWQHDSTNDVQLDQVDLSTRADLLSAIMKPSGPFYIDGRGHFNRDDAIPDPADYLAALEGVVVYEASGRIDFERLGAQCLNELMV
ncbi:MAG: HprK-related kinase B [Gammaproteobacteria bacterium]|jgi:HprK-related kinase B